MDLSHPSFRSLLAKADAAVTAAFGSTSRPDPLLGELGRTHSVAMSLTRTHGLLLEDAVAAALRHSGGWEVSQAIRFPVTDAARKLVLSNPPDILPRVRLTFDQEAAHTIDLDLAAVSVDGSRAFAIDIKRSVTAMSGGRRAALERELLAVRLLLRSFFRQQGYQVDDVEVAILDPFGTDVASGLVLNRTGIDGFFSAPVLAVVDAVTARMRAEVERRSPELFGSAQAAPTASDGEHVETLEIDGSEGCAAIRRDWGQRFAARGPSAGRRHPASAPARSRRASFAGGRVSLSAAMIDPA